MQVQTWGHWEKDSILTGLGCRSVGQEKAVFGVLTNHQGILQTIGLPDTREQGKAGMTSASVLVPPALSLLVPLHFITIRNPYSDQFLQGFGEKWRRGSESNRRIRLLQSPALPLGYPAVRTCRN